MSSREQDIAYFVSFCIEQYKNSKKLTGEQAMLKLDKFGVLGYLEDNYDVLHTQSCQWILEDIDEYIGIREKENKWKSNYTTEA